MLMNSVTHGAVMGAVKFLLLGAVCATTGCASLPYRYGRAADYRNLTPLQPGEPQIVRGKPNKFLDASGWIWPDSLLSKLLLWNVNVDRHYISQETEDALRAYLRANELTDVKIRLNSYDVGGELKRTVRNRGVGPGWRFTLGMYTWLAYTIMPGRFFGGDNYNPYSNTVSLYSDIPAVALHEAGHAKDFARRTYKGTYAFAYEIPFFDLYPEALATRDALGYLRATGTREEQQRGYNILYPAYGTYLGGNVGQWVEYPWDYLATLVGVIPGHIVGRIRSATLPEGETGAAPAPGAAQPAPPAAVR